MTSPARFLFIVVTLPALALGEMPGSEEDFLLRFREAIASKDPAKVDALTYKEGMSEQDKAMSARSNQRLAEFAGEIESISIKPLPNDFQTTAIANGRKIEMTAEPAGLVEVVYASRGPMGASASSTPFAVIDGAFVIVGPKSTDLGWEGPPDRNIGFMVVGPGADEARIFVEWNASGVDLSRTFSEASSTFWGQYIRSATVTSESEGSAFKLMILEDGETIYTSEPISGKETIEYKK